MSNEYKDYQNDIREIFNEKMDEVNFLSMGWQESFVPYMMDEMFNTLGSYVEDFEVYQIKEKYGNLMIYHGWKDRKYTTEELKDIDEINEEIYEIIKKYFRISGHTCVSCGGKAVLLSKGWVLPFCENCYDRKLGVFGFIKD